ncbi:secretory lipase-domain-containing protein [Aspergillus varians]
MYHKLVAQRQVAASFFSMITDPIQANQLLYRTTAINGCAIATVTTVFRPLRPMTDRFISFHTACDMASVTRNPNYQYQLGVFQTDLISSLEMLSVQQHVLHGYIVASPDHEGSDAALAAGRVAGIGVLDSMRVVINFQDTLGLSTDNPAIVGVGYSGGAVATGWAASLHSSYAPGSNARGGTPVNLTGTFLYLDDNTFSGFIPAAIGGMSKPSVYGAELQPVRHNIVTEKGQAVLDYASSHCVVGDLKLGPALLQHPTIASILAKSLLGANRDETPIAPAFVYHGLNEGIIPYSDILQMVNSWCMNEAIVRFTTYQNGGYAMTLLGIHHVGRRDPLHRED